MDRLISEKEIKKWLHRWIGYLDEDMIARMEMCIKDIPSAEPYKGMTNGEVIMAVKGEAKVIDNKGYKLITFTDDWWNSPYEPQESEDKE